MQAQEAQVEGLFINARKENVQYVLVHTGFHAVTLPFYH